jgi:hypothetical protein
VLDYTGQNLGTLASFLGSPSDITGMLTYVSSLKMFVLFNVSGQLGFPPYLYVASNCTGAPYVFSGEVPLLPTVVASPTGTPVELSAGAAVSQVMGSTYNSSGCYTLGYSTTVQPVTTTPVSLPFTVPVTLPLSVQ